MSRPIVIDSSVALKWFRRDEEHGVPEADSLLLDHRAGVVRLACPTHLRLEALNALRMHSADGDQLERVARSLESIDLFWVQVDEALSISAARLAADHGLTIYDATFVAAALMLDAELVTDDKAILRSGACRMRALTG